MMMMILAQADDGLQFSTLFTGGGAIGYVIIALSIVVIGLAIQMFLQVRRATILPPLIHAQIQELFANKQYREAIDMTAEQPDYLSRIIHAALTEAPHGYPAMERAMEEAAEENTTRLHRSIEWLNLIGNIAPMMGLMGTVWGMIMAFYEIKAMGGMPDAGQLGGSIGTALITTLQGLVVAVPALGLYGVLRNRIEAMTSETIVSAQELISTFRPARKTA
jgi:biopolymer transport protein ExbB